MIEQDKRKEQCLFDKITTRFFLTVCIISSLTLVLLISTAALGRYVFKFDLRNYEEFVTPLAFWLYFMGAAYGAYEGSHISADVIQAYVKEGTLKKVLISLRTVVTFFITLFFTYYAYDCFMFGLIGPLGTGFGTPKSIAWRIPLWIGYLSVFAGLVFMSYYFLRDMIVEIRVLFCGRVDEK